MGWRWPVDCFILWGIPKVCLAAVCAVTMVDAGPALPVRPVRPWPYHFSAGFLFSLTLIYDY